MMTERLSSKQSKSFGSPQKPDRTCQLMTVLTGKAHSAKKPLYPLLQQTRGTNEQESSHSQETIDERKATGEGAVQGTPSQQVLPSSSQHAPPDQSGDTNESEVIHVGEPAPKRARREEQQEPPCYQESEVITLLKGMEERSKRMMERISKIQSTQRSLQAEVAELSARLQQPAHCVTPQPNRASTTIQESNVVLSSLIVTSGPTPAIMPTCMSMSILDAETMPSKEELQVLKMNSSSTANFAVRLMRRYFTVEEMKVSNCSGLVNGKPVKQCLNSQRLEVSKQITTNLYNVPPSMVDVTWKSCTTAINAACRRLVRKPRVTLREVAPRVETTETSGVMTPH